MAIRNQDLVKVWDGKKLIEENIQFLKTPTKKVNFPLSDHIKSIIDDLVDTYKATPCAGIAANQIGYDKSIFIGMEYDDRPEEGKDDGQDLDEVERDPSNYEIYINPQIDKVDKVSLQVGDEGCLSIPNLTLQIQRYDKIKVRYYNLDGKAIKKPLNKFISRLYQHELDHLKGKLMIEDREKIKDGFINEQISKELFYQLLNRFDK
mgnify:FL=1